MKAYIVVTNAYEDRPYTIWYSSSS